MHPHPPFLAFVFLTIVGLLFCGGIAVAMVLCACADEYLRRVLGAPPWFRMAIWILVVIFGMSGAIYGLSCLPPRLGFLGL